MLPAALHAYFSNYIILTESQKLTSNITLASSSLLKGTTKIKLPAHESVLVLYPKHFNADNKEL